MMTEFLIYDLKVSVLIAAFYFCYRLLMERDTMHRTNRVVLLTVMVLSLVLPLCVITLHKTVWVEAVQVADKPGQTVTELGAVASMPIADWWQPVLVAVIVAGMAVRLLYIVQSYHQLHHIIADSKLHTLADGIRVAVTDEPVAPFSWLQTIVINRQDYAEHNPLLITHERSHIWLHHSRDVVFVELLTVLQWFNPVVWLLSRDLRTVHEYEADEAVLSQGFNMAQYISLLMTKATGIQACTLANGINTSETKKRIDMMIKKKSPRLSWLKGLYVVPIAALSLAMTAKTVTDYKPQKTNQTTKSKVADDKVLDICEELPRFPGGDAKLMEWLMKNTKYPKVATDWGVQGRIIVKFTVEKDGRITSPRVAKVTDLDVPSDIAVVAYPKDMTEQQRKDAEAQDAGLKAGAQALKDEAVRVVKLMPKWQPGKQQGRVVRCNYSIPVTFRLQ